MFWLTNWPPMLSVVGITIALISPSVPTYTVSVVWEAGTRSALWLTSSLEIVTV